MSFFHKAHAAVTGRRIYQRRTFFDLVALQGPVVQLKLFHMRRILWIGSSLSLRSLPMNKKDIRHSDHRYHAYKNGDYAETHVGY
jgi:hypothetical protein